MKVPFSPDKKFSLAVVEENNKNSNEKTSNFSVYMKGSPDVNFFSFFNLKIILNVCSSI